MSSDDSAARQGTAIGRADRRVELLAGVAVVLLVHVGLVAAVLMTPTESGAKTQKTAEEGPCTSVVSPSCCSTGRAISSASKDTSTPGPRRCPEPMRRHQRRAFVDPPPATVDLLQAQIIERLGSLTGQLPPTSPPPEKTPEKLPQAERRIEQVARIVDDGNLKKILKGGKTSRARRSKLDSILGKATGRRDGDGLVSRKGSAYVREVRIVMQNAFVLPGQVPVWLRKELRARVRITRMTATGRVLAYRVERKSGNAAFDKTVRRLMAGFKAGMRSLPQPPPHILRDINSRGMVISLRGG